MADGDPVNIPIQSSFDGAGFDAAAQAGVSLGARLKELEGQEQSASSPVTPEVKPLKGGEEVEEELHRLREGAQEFLDVLRLGVGINLGERVVESIGEIGAKFKEAVQAGIEFNAENESAINSFASTLQSVQPAIYQARDTAKSAAADVYGQVRTYAIQNGLDVKTTFEALSANYNAFVEAGATDTSKQIQFVSTILSAEASKGIDGQRALRDSIDLLQGRFNNLVFAKEIGVTADEFKRAAANGTQLDYILGHLTGYAAGINDNANSFRGLATSVGELTKQLEGSTFAPVFDEVKTALGELKVELQDPATRDGLRDIGFEVAEIVHSGAGLLEFAIRNASALSTLAQSGVAVGAALAAVKVSNLVVGLASLLTTAPEAAAALETVGTASVAVEGEAVAATAATGGLGAAMGALALNPATLLIAALAAVGAGIVKVSADIDAEAAKMNELGAAYDKARGTNSQFVADAADPAKFEARRKALQDEIDALQKQADDNKITVSDDTGDHDLYNSDGEQALQEKSLAEQRLADLEKIRAGELDVSNIKKAQVDTERELNAAEKESLATIGQALDQNNLADTNKATQADAYKSALDDAIRKTAEQSGLTQDVVSNIRSSADFQQAANGLTERQQAILAGNLQTIIAARNAYDKANDALEKQNSQLDKQSSSLNDQLGTINDKLQDQRAKLEQVKASTDTDKPAEIARIESNINALLDDQAQKRAALAKVTQQQADAAHPAAASQRDAAQKVLNQPLPDDLTPEQEQQRADARAQAQSDLNQANAVLNGKAPDSSLSGNRQARDVADPGDTDNLPNDLEDPDEPNYPNDLSQGENVVGDTTPADDTGPASQPYTGPQPPAAQPLTLPPPPQNVQTQPTTADASAATDATNTALAQANTDLGNSSQTLQQTSSQTQQNASDVSNALATAQQSDTDYHSAVMDGISGVSDNVDSLTQAVLAQNGIISAQAQQIAALQLQVQNVADSQTS